MRKIIPFLCTAHNDFPRFVRLTGRKLSDGKSGSKASAGDGGADFLRRSYECEAGDNGGSDCDDRGWIAESLRL